MSRELRPPTSAVVLRSAERARLGKILYRMRAEWWLWLGFTTSLKPYDEERTNLTRECDRMLSVEIERLM